MHTSARAGGTIADASDHRQTEQGGGGPLDEPRRTNCCPQRQTKLRPSFHGLAPRPSDPPRFLGMPRCHGHDTSIVTTPPLSRHSDLMKDDGKGLRHSAAVGPRASVPEPHGAVHSLDLTSTADETSAATNFPTACQGGPSSSPRRLKSASGDRRRRQVCPRRDNTLPVTAAGADLQGHRETCAHTLVFVTFIGAARKGMRRAQAGSRCRVPCAVTGILRGGYRIPSGFKTQRRRQGGRGHWPKYLVPF